MRAGKFELSILPEGQFTPTDENAVEVRMPLGSRYYLGLVNHSSRSCDAIVEIGGYHHGTWRLDSGDKLLIGQDADGKKLFEVQLPKDPNQQKWVWQSGRAITISASFIDAVPVDVPRRDISVSQEVSARRDMDSYGASSGLRGYVELRLFCEPPLVEEPKVSLEPEFTLPPSPEPSPKPPFEPTKRPVTREPEQIDATRLADTTKRPEVPPITKDIPSKPVFEELQRPRPTKPPTRSEPVYHKRSSHSTIPAMRLGQAIGALTYPVLFVAFLVTGHWQAAGGVVLAILPALIIMWLTRNHR